MVAEQNQSRDQFLLFCPGKPSRIARSETRENVLTSSNLTYGLKINQNKNIMGNIIFKSCLKS